MTLRCGKVLPAFAILAALLLLAPWRRKALYALNLLRKTKPARPPLLDTTATTSTRSNRRRDTSLAYDSKV